ncbi:MAG: thioredoxin domain-containing protein [Desulfococcaceae bacterium]|jgi:uncharacterized protein YyaL (SSP411 family)|nr:thioredoxin domain-containing protein [Desulfococcaceae bacterium]
MKHSNQLIHEKSPYLLQHAGNPVNWYPWSESAFAKAKEEDKPVFLSVGYATCHWCHVMERESFEDKEAAARLNDTFICIKVDREERPDIDTVYMSACQMISGRGGWPLTVFMTPDRIPFFAATYIPKNGPMGQGGIMELCRNVKELWKYKREKLLQSAAEIHSRLGRAFLFSPASDGDLEKLPQTADKAYAQLEQSFDAEYGGFDAAPKFPTPHRFFFLLRYYRRTGKEYALDMVKRSLKAMRMGGIWDHAGFGFHRYSTDRHWLLPHFEKMLYDQAMLALAYLETWEITRENFFSQTAEEIFHYVLRDMTDPEGGFYTAEDADSEGEEGRFYIWSRAEFRRVLEGTEDREIWENLLNIKSEGNFHDESTRQKSSGNIPHLAFPEKGESPDFPADLSEKWERVRQKLFAHRKQRIHPLKDDKILTDWNGLMIAALAYAGRILGKKEYLATARKAFAFIEKHMLQKDGRLLHRFRDGEAAIAAHADDYAFLIWGLLELRDAENNPLFLEKAMRFQQQMRDDFWDEENGGFYLTGKEEKDLPVRPKEIYDGALPSANSVSVSNLFRLARLSGDDRWKEDAKKTVRAFAGTVIKHPAAFTHFLTGLEDVLPVR